MKTIVLKFAGPMQSWGTDSHFEIRHTDGYPSKSAVLGLVAASLGWRRDDDRIEVLNQIEFAVRVDQIGRQLRDYQTAHKYKSTKGDLILDRTYVTTRYYLQDAIFLVALGIPDNFDGEDIISALRAPYFQPFMGRRSLPLPLDFILTIREGNPIAILEELPWQASDWYRDKVLKNGFKQKRLSIFSEDANHGGQLRMRRDYLVSLNTTGRRYLTRLEYEHNHNIDIIPNDTAHDAFGAVGGE